MDSGLNRACQPWKRDGYSSEERGVDGGESGRGTRRDGRIRRIGEFGGGSRKESEGEIWDFGLGLVVVVVLVFEEEEGVDLGAGAGGGGGGRSMGEMMISVSWERRRAGDFDGGVGERDSETTMEEQRRFSEEFRSSKKEHGNKGLSSTTHQLSS